jgi:hypothetical protein
MVQGELAGLERHRADAGIVDWLGDGLAGAVDAVGELLRDMPHLARLAVRRQHLDAAGILAGVGQGHPRGDLLVGREAEVGRILVPGREGRRVGLLDEESAGPDQDVRPDQILDDIEDLRVAHQVGVEGQAGVGERAPVHAAFGTGEPMKASKRWRPARHDAVSSGDSTSNGERKPL